MLKLPPKIVIFCFLTAVLLLKPTLSFALEITYPNIPGVAQPTNVPTMAIYLYALLLIVGAMICTLSLIYAGISWLLSHGNPGKLFAAKSQVNAGFLGLAILLLSFVFLKTINPNLTIINLPAITVPNIPVPSTVEPPPAPKNVFWELPFGFLQKQVLETTQKIVSPIDYPKEVQLAIVDVENKAKALRHAFDDCKCENLVSKCPITSPDICPIPPEGCLNQAGQPPTKTDLCPNWATSIQPKIDALKAARIALKAKQKALLIAQAYVKVAEIKLNAAKGLLASCTGPLDLKSFLQIKDQKGIEKKLFFIDITDAEKQSLTFYCNLSDEYIEIARNVMNSAIQALLAQLDNNYSCDAPGNCPLGTGPCAPENMRTYFPGDDNATKASMVCQGESSSDPTKKNLSCLWGGGADYSIGLMQINLIAWCSEAISYNYSTGFCTITDLARLTQCEQDMEDPDKNLRKAAEILRIQGWTAWWTMANRCGLTECTGGGDPPVGPPPPPVGFFNLPMNSGCVTCPYEGYMYQGGSCHEGTDFGAAEGTPIYSVAPGIIRGWGFDSGYGNWVAIEHTLPDSSKLTSFYGHMRESASDEVQSAGVGGNIDRGVFIGREGDTGASTGPHLHFALLTSLSIINGQPYPHYASSVNAELYLPAASQCVLSACDGCH